MKTIPQDELKQQIDHKQAVEAIKAYCAKCIRELPCAVCGSPVGEQGVQVGGLWVCGKCAAMVYERAA